MSENSLAEQRVRLRVVFGGISAVHVVREETFTSSKEPGRWTRRAWHRRALCGALAACVVGGDAKDWPTPPEPVDVERVTCARCLNRAAALGPPARPETEEASHG